MHNQQSQDSPTKTFLRWNDYDKMVDFLISRLDIDQYDAICGIPRGGMMLALIMSYKTNKPVITPIELAINNIRQTLIVDDIIDSGKTLKEYIDKGYDTAVVFKSNRCPITPDYFAYISDKWIVFPYECEDVEDTISEVSIENVDERHGEESK